MAIPRVSWAAGDAEAALWLPAAPMLSCESKNGGEDSQGDTAAAVVRRCASTALSILRSILSLSKDEVEGDPLTCTLLVRKNTEYLE